MKKKPYSCAYFLRTGDLVEKARKSANEIVSEVKIPLAGCRLQM